MICPHCGKGELKKLIYTVNCVGLIRRRRECSRCKRRITTREIWWKEKQGTQSPEAGEVPQRPFNVGQGW